MSDVIDPVKKGGPSTGRKRTALGEPDSETLQALAAAAVRHFSVDTIEALCGSSASLDIHRVALTDSGVDSVQVEGLTTKIECGAAVLHDVRAILELNFTAHWHYDLKWLGIDSGIKVLGSKANTIELHDIQLPMLEDFEFEIPEVVVDDVSVEIDPLSNVHLGGSDLEGLEISGTDAPSDGFSLTGIDIGNLELRGLKVPGTRTHSVRVDSFKPVDSVSLPMINLGPIDIPSVDIDDLASDGAVSVMGATLEAIEAPIFKLGDVFRIKLVVDPVLHLQIGSLVLADLQASARIDSVAAQDIRTSLCIEGLSMEDLKLERASVDRAALS